MLNSNTTNTRGDQLCHLPLDLHTYILEDKTPVGNEVDYVHLWNIYQKKIAVELHEYMFELHKKKLLDGGDSYISNLGHSHEYFR